MIDSDVRIAIKYFDENDKSKTPKLHKLRADETITALIEFLCVNVWCLKEPPESFSLRLEDTNKLITDENRTTLQNGDILCLTYSVEYNVKVIIRGLISLTRSGRNEAIGRLKKLSDDVTFKEKFVAADGINLIIRIFLDDSTEKNVQKDLLYALHQLTYLDNQFFNRSTLTTALCQKLVQSLNVSDPLCLLSLRILLNVLILGVNYLEKMLVLLNPSNLIYLLNHPNHEVKHLSLAIIIEMIKISSGAMRTNVIAHLEAPHLKVALKSIIVKLSSSHVFDKQMTFKLSQIEHYILNEKYEKRLFSQVENVTQLSLIINEALNHSRNFSLQISANSLCSLPNLDPENIITRLGFSNIHRPIDDFCHPPAALCLDLLTTLAKNHTESFKRLILENVTKDESIRFPFMSTCMEITKIIVELLHIGDDPSQTTEIFFICFLIDDDDCFEQLFILSLQLFARTWGEMRANTFDFKKVIAVVQKQLFRSFNDFNSLLSNQYIELKELPSLSLLREKLRAYCYKEISLIDERNDAQNIRLLANSFPLLQLKSQLKDNVISFVKNHKITKLLNGTQFYKIGHRKNRLKHIFMKLAPNRQFVLFDEINEKECNAKKFSHQFSVDRIVNINYFTANSNMTNSDFTSSAYRHSRRSSLPQHQLEIHLRPSDDPNVANVVDEKITLLARTEQDCLLWNDGLKVLIGRDDFSKQTLNDINLLLELECQIRLLNVDPDDLPVAVIPVPSIPDHFLNS